MVNQPKISLISLFSFYSFLFPILMLRFLMVRYMEIITTYGKITQNFSYFFVLFLLSLFFIRYPKPTYFLHYKGLNKLTFSNFILCIALFPSYFYPFTVSYKLTFTSGEVLPKLTISIFS